MPPSAWLIFGSLHTRSRIISGERRSSEAGVLRWRRSWSRISKWLPNSGVDHKTQAKTGDSFSQTPFSPTTTHHLECICSLTLGTNTRPSTTVTRLPVCCPFRSIVIMNHVIHLSGSDSRCKGVVIETQIRMPFHRKVTRFFFTLHELITLTYFRDKCMCKNSGPDWFQWPKRVVKCQGLEDGMDMGMGNEETANSRSCTSSLRSLVS